MNNFFGNMLPYEIILSVMGIIIFLALVFLMIWMVLKKRSITILLPFFLIPIIMVGYPTLSSVKVGDFIIEVREQTKLVRNNPADSVSVQNLKEKLVQLNNNKKLLNNSDALIAAANAEIALGDYESASEYLKKGEELNPGSAGINSTSNLLNEKISIENHFTRNIDVLNTSISELTKSPADTLIINRIAEVLSEIKVPDYIETDEVLTMARSYAIVGQQEHSLQAIDLLEASTEQEKINLSNLKDSVENNIFQKNLANRVQTQTRDVAKPVKKDMFNKSIIRRISR